MTVQDIDKLLREEFRKLRNRNSLTSAQWEEIKNRIWEKIKGKIKK